MKDYKLFVLLTMMTFITTAKPLMIAHAGGGINDMRYSNSLEALEYNYSNGFRYFEIDFSWTIDGQLVCLHDWKKRFKLVFGFKTKKAVSYEKFLMLLDETKGVHPCTLTSLADWVSHHPDVKIITDVKYENVKAIKLISKQFPNLANQLVPQFYQPHEYQQLKKLGFKQLIWILYQYEGEPQTIVDEANNMDLFAISMRASQAKKQWAQKLTTNKHSLFVYTINKQSKLNKLIDKYDVKGFYTDFLGVY